jgi:hypothetical protein
MTAEPVGARLLLTHRAADLQRLGVHQLGGLVGRRSDEVRAIRRQLQVVDLLLVDLPLLLHLPRLHQEAKVIRLSIKLVGWQMCHMHAETTTPGSMLDQGHAQQV